MPLYSRTPDSRGTQNTELSLDGGSARADSSSCKRSLLCAQKKSKIIRGKEKCTLWQPVRSHDSSLTRRHFLPSSILDVCTQLLIAPHHSSAAPHSKLNRMPMHLTVRAQFANYAKLFSLGWSARQRTSSLLPNEHESSKQFGVKCQENVLLLRRFWQQEK